MKSRNEVLYLLEETQEKRDAAGFLIEEEETQSCQREVFCCQWIPLKEMSFLKQ